jgi:lipopolysaccharide assembly protein A
MRAAESPETFIMRYVYMALIVVLAGIVILFKVQNFDSATVSLFSMNFTMPVSVLVFAIYVLGMFTGGFMDQRCQGARLTAFSTRLAGPPVLHGRTALLLANPRLTT